MSCSQVASPSASLADSQKHPVPEAHTGHLILNADDWGRDQENTDRILDCVICGAISSVSAMVFMEDSERAATIAREREVDAGLHLNLTTPFSAPGTPAQLARHQQRLGRHLLRHRLSPAVFHPGLASSFEYVVAAQLDEFQRLYGEQPRRIDGHHHMHLCANLVFSTLMPAGLIVRRNFTFQRSEKGFLNRLYRRFVDRRLQCRHQLTDYFFSMEPLEPPERLRSIFSLAQQSVVEVETHPVNPDEHSFLTSGEIFRLAGDIPVARRFVI